MAVYNAKRRKFQSHSTFMHHVAWGILCVLLTVVMLALWVNTQSLQRENTGLKRQLATIQTIQTTCKITGDWRAGQTKQLSIATPNGSRDYLVHLPQNFSGDHYYPLLMFYPGKGATAPAAESVYGLDMLPAIVAYPFPTVGTEGVTAWQGAPYSSSADDVAFTADIIDNLQSDLCIDRTKIYALGLSNGGGFVSVLSCKLPDRFAAYAIVEAALYYPNGGCRPPRPTPLISIHDEADNIVPYYGSLARHLPAIRDWAAMRAQMNGCKNSQELRPDATTITTVWTECQGGATVQSVQLHRGGHKWGQVPNDYLWQFLSQFKL